MRQSCTSYGGKIPGPISTKLLLAIVRPSGSGVITRKSCHHPQHIRHTNLPIPFIMKYATSATRYRCPGNGLEGYPKASEMEELKPES